MKGLLTPRLYVGAVIAAGAGLLLSLAPRELHNPGLAAGLLAACGESATPTATTFAI